MSWFQQLIEIVERDPDQAREQLDWDGERQRSRANERSQPWKRLTSNRTLTPAQTEPKTACCCAPTCTACSMPAISP